ncbi:DNA repair-scaffolding protein isoform X2 [Nelusetta ayraudi]|uniref:DNA repair-scaffolding protein isoform X2 n=1 Tax=Nelusetta ayraudi TaxID=303726 RepID=UPI003F6EE359
MTYRKRKRHIRDLSCVLFPDDADSQFKKVGKEPSLLSAPSAKSWERCGDSFLDHQGLKNIKSSGRKLSVIRKLVESPLIAQTGTAQSHDDIAWSSSDSEQSDDGSRDQRRSTVLVQQRHRRPTAPIQTCGKVLCKPGTDEVEDPPVIDTDSDQDRSEDDADKDSGQQISDCDSDPYNEEQEAAYLKSTNATALELSGYVSDGESPGRAAAASSLDSQGFPPQTGEGARRSVSDWVRSAQAILQTPQKHITRKPKTPDDSAKKKRKFQSGGLAERLSRLQNRQRSAVSFWRHESLSDSTVETVDRPGVLVLEVLQVLEECSMKLVSCKRRQSPGEESALVTALFNRETAALLTPAPRDIIHVHPPWQSLSIEGFSCEFILNTHFSQKVFSAPKAASASAPGGLSSGQRCSPYALCQTFGLLDISNAAVGDGAKQLAASAALWGFAGPGVSSRRCLSLLEVIEGLGQAGSVRQDVEVVVQRVYSVPVSGVSSMSALRARGPPRSSSSPPAEKGRSRLCILVQDNYGMFSVVQLHILPCSEDLQRYCHTWQGKTCVLRGIKVVQRVTRERRARLFYLIDSLWPPVMPPGDCGNTPNTYSESRPVGPPPSFCYLLSGLESSVQAAEGDAVSPLYRPASTLTLRDVMQTEPKSSRCSFAATVIFKRFLRASDVGHDEVWLVVTDPSLQREQLEGLCMRTVPLCLSTSCVLTSPVLLALKSPAACRMSFRDAIREQGRLLCAEQSVVELCPLDPEPQSVSLCGPQAETLPQPVRLDPLSPEVTPNAICSLTGVITGVDESTAYSWPACNHCGSDNLEKAAGGLGNVRCRSCDSAVDKPDTRMHLHVFLTSSMSNGTIKVKLQQKTIMSILNTAALEGDKFSGYDVESILGKEIGPLTVLVRVVTRKPVLWMGLEEICL